MTPEVAVDLFREALSLTALVVAAIIVPSLLVGLLVAMFQLPRKLTNKHSAFYPG